MLWTLTEPLLAGQLGALPQPLGNYSAACVPHGLYRCAGDDDWIGIAVTSDAEWKSLCAVVPALSPLAERDLRERRNMRDEIDAALAGWARPLPAQSMAADLIKQGVPAAALATSRDLAEDPHLKARAFWDAHDTGALPGLPGTVAAKDGR